jgi:hypothetical protein
MICESVRVIFEHGHDAAGITTVGVLHHWQLVTI